MLLKKTIHFVYASVALKPHMVPNIELNHHSMKNELHLLTKSRKDTAMVIGNYCIIEACMHFIITQVQKTHHDIDSSSCPLSKSFHTQCQVEFAHILLRPITTLAWSMPGLQTPLGQNPLKP